jgi:hypothetical protein
LLPALVPFLGVGLDVALGQLGEGASAALGPLLGRRVLAPGDREHRLGRERAGVGEADGVGVAQMQPARTTMAAVDHHPRSRAARLYSYGEPTLQRVPHEIGGGLGLELLHAEFSQPLLAGRALWLVHGDFCQLSHS